MRIVRLTKDDFEQTIMVDGKVTRLTGTDAETGERVKFRLTDPGYVNTMVSLAARQGSIEIPLADVQIIAVLPPVEPVSGEWDSPGTSPEGDDD